MPLAGRGMLLTSMDIDAADEADFNRWYDREHLAERVALDGFLEARRYIAHNASPKYLCLYSTVSFEVLDSPAYRARLANPTDWSRKVMARFKNMIRVVARVTISRGAGRGSALGVVRLRPHGESEDKLREVLRKKLDPATLDGIVSMHLIESDPVLSGPTVEIPSAGRPGAFDWFILIDGTHVNAITDAMASRFTGRPVASGFGTPVSVGSYNLMWDLPKNELWGA